MSANHIESKDIFCTTPIPGVKVSWVEHQPTLGGGECARHSSKRLVLELAPHGRPPPPTSLIGVAVLFADLASLAERQNFCHMVIPSVIAFLNDWPRTDRN
jgi:hypothetical protein